jgi:hypothetical protein
MMGPSAIRALFAQVDAARRPHRFHRPPLSLPGLTGQSSTPGRCLLDRPVKPGDDSKVRIDPTKTL